MFRNVTLKCLTEIAGVSVSQYEEQFVTLFTLTMMQLKQVTKYNQLAHTQQSVMQVDVNIFFGLYIDAASEHKHPSCICKWEGRRTELHPEPELVPLHLSQRAWPAHWEKAQPARDSYGGMCTRTSDPGFPLCTVNMWTIPLAPLMSLIDNHCII